MNIDIINILLTIFITDILHDIVRIIKLNTSIYV